MANSGNYKILIVDGDPDQQFITGRLLTKEGYVVSTQSNGMDCMTSIETDRPDLIILDVMLPDINGFEVCHLIKSNPDFENIHIILLSGSMIKPENIAEGLAIGADGYMVKPVNEREFIARVKAACRLIKSERSARESEKTLRSLFINMSEGVALHEILYNETGEPVDYRLLKVNPAFTFHTGISEEQASHKTATELYGDAPPFLDIYARVAASGNPYVFEVFYESMKKHFSISVSSPEKGQFVTIFQDITKRKISEQALLDSEEKFRELNQNLEKHVEERTAELIAANQELEAFAYTVSHDLRAPVRAISGFTKILEADHLPSLNAEGRRVFRVIQENTQKMDHLIDDLLSFSRLSRSEMNLTRVNMKKIVVQCFNELTAHESRQKISITIDELPEIRGDHAMLVQVWTNLLSNAIKFTSHCEAPALHIEGHREGDEIVYSISDNGTGFDMKYVDKLFGVFQRLHSVKEYDGTGVGLAIVQRIIRRHDGRVWAKGEVGKGAKFSFTLKP